MKFNIKYLFFTMAFSSVAVNAQLSLPADSVDKAKKEVNVLFGQQEYGRFVGNACRLPLRGVIWKLIRR